MRFFLILGVLVLLLAINPFGEMPSAMRIVQVLALVSMAALSFVLDRGGTRGIMTLILCGAFTVLFTALLLPAISPSPVETYFVALAWGSFLGCSVGIWVARWLDATTVREVVTEDLPTAFEQYRAGDEVEFFGDTRFCGDKGRVVEVDVEGRRLMVEIVLFNIPVQLELDRDVVRHHIRRVGGAD